MKHTKQNKPAHPRTRTHRQKARKQAKQLDGMAIHVMHIDPVSKGVVK